MTPATPWLQTHTGRAFPLIDPEPEDVRWPDVIYALAHTNRFTGHVGNYSVAQHSCVVADQLRPEWRLYGLLHDAHEAFIGDVSTPLKTAIMSDDLWLLTEGINRAIYLAADLAHPVPQTIAEAIKVADLRALMTERRDLMKKPPRSWGDVYENIVPLEEKIIRWTPEQAVARYAIALGGAGLPIGTCVFVGS